MGFYHSFVTSILFDRYQSTSVSISSILGGRSRKENSKELERNNTPCLENVGLSVYDTEKSGNERLDREIREKL